MVALAASVLPRWFFIGGCLFAISFIGVIVCVGILFFVWFLLPVLVKKIA